MLFCFIALFLPLCHAGETDLAEEAEKTLFSARYAAAAELYAKLVQQDPSSGFAHDRLVRALLEDHQNDRAYKAAETAAQLAPDTAPVWNALGRVAFRKGDLGEAERLFRKAIAKDPKYPDALVGLANIYSVVSRLRSSENLMKLAFRLNPRDPDMILFHANQLESAEHETELKQALAVLDPASDPARTLRAHIARDAALHGRKRKLLSTREPTQIKLITLVDGPQRTIGLGVEVRLNDKASFRLKLDTGAGGISISPKAAARAGLEVLGDVSVEAHGLGDKVPDAKLSYLAAKLRIGSLEWENFPVAVFRGARAADTDGLIGTDIFSQFLVTIDFPAAKLSLEPYGEDGKPGESSEAGQTPAGFTRFFRFGHLLLIPTFLNGGSGKLFLLDSGAMVNLVDIHTAQSSTKLQREDQIHLRGVQGEVKDVRRAEQGTIRFAGFQQANPGMAAIDLHGLSDNTGTEVSGILGMQVLWRLKISIDYRNGAVKMERSSTGPH